MSIVSEAPRDAGSWKVPNRTKVGEARHTTAPGSYFMSPLHAARVHVMLMYALRQKLIPPDVRQLHCTFCWLLLASGRSVIVRDRSCDEISEFTSYSKRAVSPLTPAAACGTVRRKSQGTGRPGELTCRTCRAGLGRRCGTGIVLGWWEPPGGAWPHCR